MWQRIKDRLIEVGYFLGYILLDLFKELGGIIESLNRPRAIFYFLALIGVYQAIFKKGQYVQWLLIAMFVVYIWMTNVEGRWRHNYRQWRNKKLKEKYSADKEHKDDTKAKQDNALGSATESLDDASKHS